MRKKQVIALATVFLFVLVVINAGALPAAARQAPPEPPVITEPASIEGWANALDCPNDNCELKGIAPANATVIVYRKVWHTEGLDHFSLTKQGNPVQANARGNWTLAGIPLQEGENVFVAYSEVAGVRSEPSADLHVEHFYADTYGYHDGRFFGADSSGAATEAAEVLRSGGYNSCAHTAPSAAEALQSLKRDSVFDFSGHADNARIQFLDENSSTLLGGGDVRAESMKEVGRRWRLIVLNGCQTGRDVTASDSIMAAFFDQGADMVIGWRHKVTDDGGELWHKLFWQYAISDQMECEDAALRAARVVAGRYWWPWNWIPHAGDWIEGAEMTEDNVRILRTQDVYLVPAQHPGPPRQGDLGIEPPVIRLPNLPRGGGIRAWFEKWTTQARGWWQRTTGDLERRIADWWEQLKEDVSRRIQEALEKEAERRLREICGGSGSIVLLVAIAAGVRQRGMRRK